MAGSSQALMRRLLDLQNETGYDLVQQKGHRQYGPPPDWAGSPPQKGCEVFVGKLPRDIFEDELVPIFSRCGKIYKVRLMMDYFGGNRGFMFVNYTMRSEACRAVKELNGYEIRQGRNIRVEKSVDNCRLFVGRIPKTKTKEEVIEELSKWVYGIVDVTLYKNCFDRRLNRGFAYVEFASHLATVIARKTLGWGFVNPWDHNVYVRWAEPEPDFDDEQMTKVKVLFVRNFLIRTTLDTIKTTFETAINNKIQRIKKLYDYAFIHFYEREHAERAMIKLQSTEIDGSNIEITWLKPVRRELYRHQNLKGIGSGYGGSPCSSSTDIKPMVAQKERTHSNNESYTLAPAKLDSVCNGYMWALPVYEYKKYFDHHGLEVWVGQIMLPQVGLPLLNEPGCIGPLITTTACYSMQQAQVEAAESALNVIEMLMSDRPQPASPALMQPM